MQDHQVKLSEFMPSLRDLEIVRLKNEVKLRPQQTEEAAAEQESALNFKDITDLAALPVQDHIDVKLQIPSCELCGEEFKSSVSKARDKSIHLISHFKEEIMRELPQNRYVQSLYHLQSKK